jgi:hypothetical protein
MGKEDIGNPESMTSKEEVKFDKYKVLFKNLFDELKRKNKIKLSRHKDVGNFINIMKTLDAQGINHNLIIEIIKDKKISDEFISINSKYGFNEFNYTKQYLFQSIHMFNSSTEVLKLLLIIILDLKNEKQTLGQILTLLQGKKYAPINGKTLKSKIDLDLRNSFSHNFYWIDENRLMVSKYSSLKEPFELKIVDLMKKGKDINMLFQAFIKVFADKSKTNFFD